MDHETTSVLNFLVPIVVALIPAWLAVYNSRRARDALKSAPPQNVTIVVQVRIDLDK